MAERRYGDAMAATLSRAMPSSMMRVQLIFMVEAKLRVTPNVSSGRRVYLRVVSGTTEVSTKVGIPVRVRKY
jgi:hypothetical protein